MDRRFVRMFAAAVAFSFACAALRSALVARGPVPANSATELKERLEVERGGRPFLVYRDGDDGQVIRTLDCGRLSVRPSRLSSS